MKKIIILLILSVFLVIACSPQNIKPWTPPEIKFEKTSPYSVQELIDKIPKPSPPIRIFVKQIDEKTYEVIENKSEATHVMLAPKEYAKVGAIVKLTKTYKELILDQEILINTYINQINALKELFAMEQKKSQMYQELWISSENAYRQEVRDHKLDNVIHKATLGGIGIGSLILLFLLL